MTPTFRNFGLKNRIFARAQKSKNLIAVVESEGVAIFFRPCRGPSLALVSIHMMRRVVTPKSGAKHSSLGRRFVNPGGLPQKWTRHTFDRTFRVAKVDESARRGAEIL